MMFYILLAGLVFFTLLSVTLWVLDRLQPAPVVELALTARPWLRPPEPVDRRWHAIWWDPTGRFYDELFLSRDEVEAAIAPHSRIALIGRIDLVLEDYWADVNESEVRDDPVP